MAHDKTFRAIQDEAEKLLNYLNKVNAPKEVCDRCALIMSMARHQADVRSWNEKASGREENN